MRGPIPGGIEPSAGNRGVVRLAVSDVTPHTPVLGETVVLRRGRTAGVAPVVFTLINGFNELILFINYTLGLDAAAEQCLINNKGLLNTLKCVLVNVKAEFELSLL